MPKTSQYIPFDKLKLDLSNMRYNKIVGQMNSEKEVIDYMFNFENLDELIKKIVSKGYENDEALWVIEDGGDYVVKEGNRRLSALKVLADVKKYKDKIKLTKNYNISPILCSVYTNHKVLNDRIIDRHTQDSIKGWNRLAQSFRIQEEYNKYGDWDKVNGGTSKKDLYKVANFYEKAHIYCKSMINTFVKDDEDEVKSKFEVWRRLFGFGLPKNNFGFEFNKNLEIKILNEDVFSKFVEHTTGLLLSNKIKSADVVKDNIDNLLRQHFSDFIVTPPDTTPSGKTGGSSGTSKTPKTGTPSSTTTPGKTTPSGTVKKKPHCQRDSIAPKIQAIIKECYALPDKKFPNAKTAMTRVVLEGVLKYVIENTKYNGRSYMNKSNYFRNAFFDKHGNKREFTDFTLLKNKFSQIITDTGLRKAFEQFDLEGTHQVIHNYHVGATSVSGQQFCDNLLPILEFLLRKEPDLLADLDVSKL